jgi:serine/threonine protein kinase
MGQHTIHVTEKEWEEAEQWFQAHPKKIKFQKKQTTGKKNGGHSFVKINDQLIVLNNTQYKIKEADVGSGGFKRGKFGISRNGEQIFVAVEAFENIEHTAQAEEIKKIQQEIGYRLGSVFRPVANGRVKAVDALKTQVKVYTAYQYLGDRDLFDELTTLSDARSRPKNLIYALKTMQGVQMIHELGIIHKDLKHQNFVVNGQGENLSVMPVDFDMSQKLSPGKTYIIGKGIDGTIGKKYTYPKSGTFKMGRYYYKPGYVAPEIWEQKKYSFASDVYALGRMLKEMCLSERLYGPMKAHVDKRITLPEAIDAVKSELASSIFRNDPEVKAALRVK